MTNKKLPTENLVLEGMEVLSTPFRNLTGRPTTFNPDGGKRYFNIRLAPDLAAKMNEEGWPVKELKPRDPEDPMSYIMEVKVSFKGRPPRVVTVTPTGRKTLMEDVVETLDIADIDFADLIVRPYDYGGERVSVYLQTGYFNIKLDELEMKYELEDEEKVICDDEGICYIDGVRIN